MAIRRNIEQHEDKLRVINSVIFQFAKVTNQLDMNTEELALKIKDTIGALIRRSSMVQHIEDVTALKVRTTLEQSMACLPQQLSPVALLKTRLTQDLWPEKK